MRRSALVAAAVMGVLGGSPSWAQMTTGTIVGTVTDDTGAVLPGVSVVLKGANVVGTQTSVANEKGFYRFPALPPGSYNVTFTMSGFNTLNRDSVHVPLGQTVEQNVSLKLSQKTEEVTVIAEAPVVNSQTNLVATNYDKDWVRNAPISRFSFFDYINAAPGVNQTGTGTAVSTSLGSATTDNSYQLDGTDFTAPATGESWPYPNSDAIEEIEVLSLGAPAEYGNLLGAVFNVVTRQGTNQYHGDLNFYWQGQGLTGKNTTPDQDSCTDAAGNSGPCPFKRVKFNDLTAQLDGPILKDKLWFFVSYQYQRDSKIFAGSIQDPNYANTTNADRMFVKLNYQINTKNKLLFAYHDDFYHLPCQVIVCSPSRAPSTNTLEHGHNPSPNLTYTGVISDKTYVEARVSGFYGKDHGDPLNPGEPRTMPRYSDAQTGQVTGGIYSWYDGDVWKNAASAKISHFADNFLGGSHDFKFGVQFSQGGSQYVRGLNDYIYTYGGVPTAGYTQIPFHQGGVERNIAFWGDDTFRVNSRLTLNFGLRYDNSRASFDAEPILDSKGNSTGQMSPAVSNLFTWKVVSPRVGFTFKLTPDGRTVVKAHYGRYYRGIITGEFQNIAPSTSPIFSFSGTYDAAGNPIGLAPFPKAGFQIDPNFQAPYTDQYILQLEREVLKDIGLSVNFVHKDGKRYGAFNDVGGQYSTVLYQDTVGAEATGKNIPVYAIADPSQSSFLLTNPPGMFSKFNGATFQVTKRMSHHWQLVGSLVLSKSTGRLVSSLGGPAAEPSAALLPGQPLESTFGQNRNAFVNTDGRLIGDRPVTGKIQFVAELPAGFLLGLNFTHQSGRPWERLIALPSSLVGVSNASILAQPLDGNRRLKAWDILDVRLQKAIGLGKGVSFDLFVDALNLTNNDANDDVGSRLGTAANFGMPVSFILPRRAMLGAKLTF